MRFFLFLMMFSAALSTSSRAGAPVDSANGNLIPEPKLADYHVAERTPGFSPITDVVDANGN